MIDLKVTGADDLSRLSIALKGADKSMKRELYRGLNRATKPLKADAQRAAAAKLPQSGGLAARVAKSRFSTRTRMGREVAVSITAKDSAAATTNRGFVVHPVFGRGSVRQAIDGGDWFTDAMRAGADEVRAEIVEAIDNVADQIKRSV